MRRIEREGYESYSLPHDRAEETRNRTWRAYRQVVRLRRHGRQGSWYASRLLNSVVLLRNKRRRLSGLPVCGHFCRDGHAWDPLTQVYRDGAWHNTCVRCDATTKETAAR